MKKILQILVNFMVRAIVGIAIIYYLNQFLEQKEILISVGINGISFSVAGLLGLPGVALLYGIVALAVL
jgi:inhibitor of the pro-sigma K processing machinery